MSMLFLGVVLLATAGTGCGWLTWRLAGRLRSVFGGIAVEGRCVRRYSTESSDGDTMWHHVHGFTTLDGQYLEFEEDVMLLAEGEKLTVRYRPENPVRSATVMGPGGAWSPLFGQAFGILITGMFSLLGLLFLWLSLTQ
ncbi:DUF3592 domain-containing protein [Streptomyces sp. NPDC051994]|uniref:DUF3592 domain-containing protein n=1 Tax=unclassified Streptomyces TaxID=2593676 RepID=UPI003439C440